MRVISGQARGHRIKSLKGLHTRPTLDRVREAVFNVLGPKTAGAVFLDLFAGTGAVGIEALSRGADLCCFNDIYKPAIKIIKENLTKCGLQDKARIFNREALTLLKDMEAKEEIVFDIVYLDPPYTQGLYEPVLQQLALCKLLKRDSVIVVESSNHLELASQIGDLEVGKKSKYGDTAIWYYYHR